MSEVVPARTWRGEVTARSNATAIPVLTREIPRGCVGARVRAADTNVRNNFLRSGPRGRSGPRAQKRDGRPEGRPSRAIERWCSRRLDVEVQRELERRRPHPDRIDLLVVLV